MDWLLFLFAAGVWAGAQNALSGGGSFVTLPILILSGLTPQAANVASTVALFPGQVLTGVVGREAVGGLTEARVRWLMGASVVGGFLGALLLLRTPPGVFSRLVPWLVLFATGLFALGAFRRPALKPRRLDPRGIAAMQLVIGVYGGYFGGGNGLLMLAVLTAGGIGMRAAGATKNVLAAIINSGAVAVFLFTATIPWLRVAALAAGAGLGGVGGAMLLHRIDERLMRVLIVLLGALLFIGLLLRQS